MRRFSLLAALVLLGCGDDPTEPEPNPSCVVATTPIVGERGDTVGVVRTEFCTKIVGAVP